MSAATIDHFAASIEVALGAAASSGRRPVLDHLASLDAASARHGAPVPAHAPLAAWESSEYPAPLRAAHAATQARPTHRDGRPVVAPNSRPTVAGREQR